MRQCDIGGCYKRVWAAGECLDHYVAHRHDVTASKALAIRSASGSARDIARNYGVSVARVWEIRGTRWWKHIL